MVLTDLKSRYNSKNMKKLLIISSAVLFAAGAFAQDKLAETNSDENNKVEHIMELIDVDQATAEKAAALLDDFRSVKKETMEKRMQEKKDMRGNMEKMGDDEIEKLHRQRLDDQRSMIDLEEEYYNKFLAILPATKVEKVLREARKQGREKMRAQRMQRKGSSQQKLHE